MDVKFEIIRSARKTVAIEVTRDGRVLVRAPQRMAYDDIVLFVDKNKGWIDDKMKHVYNMPQSRGSGALHKFAEDIIFPRAEFWAKTMGLRPTGIRITDAEKRFGSCSPKNSLCFSNMLAYYPEAAIDYVIVHELAHIVHKNHGKDFYSLIERYLPDYREREEMLKGKPRELWDLYDSAGNKTGKFGFRGEAMPAGMYHLVANVGIFDDEGRMLIQRRAACKSAWPGMWDLSACGSALAGETSSQAAIRETREELGVDIDPGAMAMRLRAHHFFDDYYIVHKNIKSDELTLQKEEVAQARFATRDEIYALLESGEFMPYHQPLVDMLFCLHDKIGPFRG